MPSQAQYRRAWVAHWDGGAPANTNYPVALKCDAAGNMYVAGSTLNTSNLLDYVTLKYDSKGGLLWEMRYTSANLTNNLVRGMYVGTNDDVYITGTTETVKYSQSGVQQWTAPLNGRAVAASLGTNIIVTGITGTMFETACLTPFGSNRWTAFAPGRTAPDGSFQDTAMAVVCNSAGVSYVAGSAIAFSISRRINNGPRIVSYDKDGVLLNSPPAEFPDALDCQITDVGVALTGAGNVVTTCNVRYPTKYLAFFTLGFTPDLTKQWLFSTNMGQYLVAGVRDMTVAADSIYLAGENVGTNRTGRRYYGMIRLNSDGSTNRVTSYGQGEPDQDFQQEGANAIVASASGDSFTSGYATRANGLKQSVTVQFSADGHVVWADEYDSGAKLDDEGRAIVLDAAGNIYVAGVSANAQGGSEIVLIKYEPTQAAVLPDGNTVVQFPGTPGQPMKIEGTTTLKPTDWVQIGLGLVPASGMFSVEDTNAVNYPFRFYRAIQNP